MFGVTWLLWDELHNWSKMRPWEAGDGLKSGDLATAFLEFLKYVTSHDLLLCIFWYITCQPATTGTYPCPVTLFSRPKPFKMAKFEILSSKLLMFRFF